MNKTILVVDDDAELRQLLQEYFSERDFVVLLADGGASRNDFLMQFQADILDRPVVRSASGDVSAIGAAWLAGLATGVWPSLEALAALPRAERRFEPGMAAADRRRLYDGWREAVQRAIGPFPNARAVER